jgi:hypothetical protein
MSGGVISANCRSAPKLLQVHQHLLVSQPGTLISLRVFHVAGFELPQSDSYRLPVNTPQNFRLSECVEVFGVSPIGTVR